MCARWRWQLAKARENEMRLTGQMGTVPEKEKQGLDIKRQQELKSSLYTYLLNKREEVALQTAINEANVRLVEGTAGKQRANQAAQKSVILLIGLIIGLLIPERHPLAEEPAGREHPRPT